jgi:hypothetical protein
MGTINQCPSGTQKPTPTPFSQHLPGILLSNKAFQELLSQIEENSLVLNFISGPAKGSRPCKCMDYGSVWENSGLQSIFSGYTPSVKSLLEQNSQENFCLV